MTKQTASLSLSKPEITDKIVDTITQLASNFDVIDSSLAQKAKKTDLNSIALLVRSSGSDDTANINDAINTVSQNGGGKVLLPDTSYLALGIQLQSNVILEGYQTRIIKNGGNGVTRIIESKGSVTGTPSSLSADAKIGDTTITVASTTNIQTGDYVLVRDTNYVSGSAGRNQEICRVSSVTSTTITFVVPLIGAYTVASSAEFVEISPILGASIKGLILNVPSGTSGGGFYGFLNVGTFIEKCESLRPKESAAFTFEQSTLCRIKRSIAKDGQTPATSGTSYGFYIGDSSMYCFVEDCYSENVRENPISWRSRYCGFINNKDRGAYDDSFNSHGTGNDHVYIKGNWSTGSKGQGIAVGSSSHVAPDTNVFIEDNVITNSGYNGIFIASPNSGLLNNKNIYIKNNKITNVGINAVNSYGVTVSNSDSVEIDNNDINGKSNQYGLQGIVLTTVAKAKLRNNNIFDFTNGYGIVWQTNCNDILIERNTFDNIASFNLRELGTNTNIIIRHNKADDTTVSLLSNPIREANVWGTKRDRDKGGTSVADGGTIAHNCPVAPTSIRVTGSVAGEFVSITAVTATNFTVAIKKHDGTVGTTQTVYWEAEV